MPELIIKDLVARKAWKVIVRRPRITIGKSESNDIVLSQPGVSRQHCVLYHLNGRTMVQDLNSSNGTFVNGVQIEDDTVLDDASVLQIGPFQVTYREPQNGPRRRSTASARSATVTAPEGAKGRHAERQEEPEAEEEAGSLAAAEEDAEAEGGEELAPVAAEQEASEEKVFFDLRRRIHEKLLEDKKLKQLDFSTITEEEAREKTKAAVLGIFEQMQGEIPSFIDRKRLLKEILDEALGLGPLEDFLADASINEIMVNNYDKIFVEESNGKIRLTRKKFIDNYHLIETIRRIVAPIGRRINESTPMVDARLKDGSRVNAVIPPVSVSGPTLTIRKFSKRRLTVEDLVRLGTVTNKAAKMMETCIVHRANTCVSGGTGSGKTTLLNILSAFIPEGERIVTVEDVSELRLAHQNLVSMESRPPSLEGSGEIPIRKLVINALRMRPDRILVGECRGGEAFDMMQAMNTGHDGSLTTVHANSPKDALARMENMVLMAGMELPARAIREQLASALNLIIQIARLSDGSRRVIQITEVTGLEGDVITLQDIFRFERKGVGAGGKIIGDLKPTGNVPKFFQRLREQGIPVDLSILQ